ncbi:MAG: hypothetical protein M3464_16975 [Chloroflexota bacterium]|nr:hypothetical protein [Chloroflexota bacterium]
MDGSSATKVAPPSVDSAAKVLPLTSTMFSLLAPLMSGGMPLKATTSPNGVSV